MKLTFLTYGTEGDTRPMLALAKGVAAAMRLEDGNTRGEGRLIEFAAPSPQPFIPAGCSPP